jgi:hypothetical protein
LHVVGEEGWNVTLAASTEQMLEAWGVPVKIQVATEEAVVLEVELYSTTLRVRGVQVHDLELLVPSTVPAVSST